MFDDELLYHPVYDAGGVTILEDLDIPEPPAEIIVSASDKKYIFCKGGSRQKDKKDVE